MHWILQSNLNREEGYQRLKEAIKRYDLPHTEVKVVPIFKVLEHDIEVKNPVIVMGSLSLCEIAREKGWTPGAFTGCNMNHGAYLSGYGKNLLNHDAVVCEFGRIEPKWDVFFMRPYHDTKSFAGEVTDLREYQNWSEKVRQLEKENYTTLSPDTLVTIAPVKKILREYRFYIVDGQVVTGSLYKIGTRVTYQENVDDANKYAQQMVDRWRPQRAFVMDVALTEEGYKVIELNCFNGAGFYACDLSKIVQSVENMEGYS
jgi:hypothetical protein